jgi:hopanoid biosynthesis associated radical SAM protein HpnH
MRFPVHMLTDNVQHQVKNAIRGNKRYPFVLMLEPLYTCNLACIGCAIERHTGKLKDRLPLEKCLEAVDISQAPTVSICGGEPTIYPELPQLVDEIIKRKRQIILCTNGLLLDENLYGKIPPHKRLTINVHLDGMKETHDYVCAREGVFDKAIAMIKEGVKLGHHMMANTTIFKETSMQEVEDLCKLLTDLGCEGMLVSPGYQYESVDSDIFLNRSEMQQKFRRVIEISKKYKLTSTPMFLEFAAGLREYQCSPWSTVTYTPNGWKGPCYLIGKTWSPTFEEFWNGTDWSYWESRQDPLCRNCAMHSGFEASVVRELPKHPGDMVRMIAWNLAA